VTPSDLSELAPHVDAARARGALWIPGECALDSFAFPFLLLAQFREGGGAVRFGFEVTRATRLGSALWQLESRGGARVSAKLVVNCAGLYGDQVEQLKPASAAASRFRIVPRKGQFAVLSPLPLPSPSPSPSPSPRASLPMVLPVPTRLTKGVLVYSSVHGDTVVGPTAEPQQSRQDATIDAATLDRLVATGARAVPAVAQCERVFAYAGLRPATEAEDYVIAAHAASAWVTVAGIRSTGVSAALGIGEYVCFLVGRDSADAGAASVELARQPWTHAELDRLALRTLSHFRSSPAGLLPHFDPARAAARLGDERLRVCHPIALRALQRLAQSECRAKL
jgi:glycerol-3-phosphate dehydrogenase